MTFNKQAQVIISDIRLKHGSGDIYAPIIRWDEFEVIAGALEAAEKRIAELEAREVKLPKSISVLHRRDFNDAHRSIYAYPEAEVNAALAAAGIKIKGE